MKKQSRYSASTPHDDSTPTEGSCSPPSSSAKLDSGGEGTAVSSRATGNNNDSSSSGNGRQQMRDKQRLPPPLPSSSLNRSTPTVAAAVTTGPAKDPQRTRSKVLRQLQRHHQDQPSISVATSSASPIIPFSPSHIHVSSPILGPVMESANASGYLTPSENWIKVGDGARVISLTSSDNEDSFELIEKPETGSHPSPPHHLNRFQHRPLREASGRPAQPSHSYPMAADDYAGFKGNMVSPDDVARRGHRHLHAAAGDNAYCSDGTALAPSKSEGARAVINSPRLASHQQPALSQDRASAEAELRESLRNLLSSTSPTASTLSVATTSHPRRHHRRSSITTHLSDSSRPHYNTLPNPAYQRRQSSAHKKRRSLGLHQLSHSVTPPELSAHCNQVAAERRDSMLSDNRKKGGSSGTVAAVVGGQTCATLDGGEENPEFASVPLTHTTTPATTLASSADCRHRGYSASASVESGGEEEEKKEGKADAPSTAIPSLFGQSGDVTASAAHSEQGKPEDDNGTLSLSVHDAEDQIQRSIFFVECQYGCKRRCCHQSKRHLLDTGVGGNGRKSSSELRPYALILFGAGFCMGIGAGIWYLHHRSPSAVGGSSNVAAATGRIPPVDVASNAYQHRWFGYQVPPIPPVILAPT